MAQARAAAARGLSQRVVDRLGDNHRRAAQGREPHAELREAVLARRQAQRLQPRVPLGSGAPLPFAIRSSCSIAPSPCGIAPPRTLRVDGKAEIG